MTDPQFKDFLSAISPNPTSSAITQIFDLIKGITGQDIKQGQQAAAAADPFASQRGQYQQQLQGLMTDPSSFKTDPGYQFALQQGQDALLAKAASVYGGGGAGAVLPELAKYTEGYAAQNYDTRINQLMQMAGVNAGSPGTAGAIMAGAFNNRDASLASGSQVLGSLLDLLAGGGKGGALSGLGGIIKSIIGGGGIDWNSISGSGNFGPDIPIGTVGSPDIIGQLAPGLGIDQPPIFSIGDVGGINIDPILAGLG